MLDFLIIKCCTILMVQYFKVDEKVNMWVWLSSSSFSCEAGNYKLFSRHIDLWQGWLSLLLPSHFHHTLTHVGCRQGKRCIQVSFCHEMVCREHIFWQVLSSSGNQRICPRKPSWHFLTQWTRGSVLVMVYIWWCWRHGLFIWFPAWSYSKRL